MDDITLTLLRNIAIIPQETIKEVEELGIHSLEDLQKARKHIHGVNPDYIGHVGPSTVEKKNKFDSLDKSVCGKLFVLAELMRRNTNMTNLTPEIFNNFYQQHLEFLYICDVVVIPPHSRLRLLHRGVYTPEDIRNIQPAMFVQEFLIDTGVGTYKKLILMQHWLRRNRDGNILQDFDGLHSYEDLEVEYDGFIHILEVVGISPNDRLKLEDMGYCTTTHIREMKERVDNIDLTLELQLTHIGNGQHLKLVSQWMHEHPHANIEKDLNDQLFSELRNKTMYGLLAR